MTLFDLLFSLDSSFGEKLQRSIENACKIAEGIKNAINRFPIDGFVEVSCSLALVEHNYPPCLRLSGEQQISMDAFESHMEGYDVLKGLRRQRIIVCQQFANLNCNIFGKYGVITAHLVG